MHTQEVYKKICDMFKLFAILHYHWVCGCGETRSPCKSYKRLEFYKKKSLGLPNDDAWKGYSIFQGHCSWTPQGAFTVPHMNSKLHTCWFMAYNQKTQSFRKNGDQQMCFNKALKTVKKHPNKLDIRQFLVLLYDCVPNMKDFWSIVRFF